MHPAPDILHGSYLISEQSPASSHNTPVLSHTRSFNIPSYCPYVKQKFSISAKIFGIFFVQVYEINFRGNRGGRRGVRRKICGTAQRPSRIHYLWCVLSFLPCSCLYSGDPFPQCAHWGLPLKGAARGKGLGGVRRFGQRFAAKVSGRQMPLRCSLLSIFLLL